MKIRAVLVVLLLARSALADNPVVVLDRTCVEIDGAVDQLAAADREHATELLQRVLERRDLLVVTTECTETYTLSHEPVGAQYVIRVHSPAGKRRITTPALDELSSKYEKMVRSLLEAKREQAEAAQRPAPEPQVAASTEPQVAAAESMQEPLPTAEPIAVDAEEAPASDEPAAKKNTWYALAGGQLVGGVAWGFGYRRNSGMISIDASLNGRASESGGTEAASVGVEVLRNKRLAPSIIGYAGGGLSAGSMSRGTGYYGTEYYEGSGVHGELTAGMQVGKARGMQLIGQLDITLPFYRMGNQVGDKDYAAAAVLSGGIGF
jgi:hypothetical protein